jgi:hypothetical protein
MSVFLKPEGSIPFRSPRGRGEDNIAMDLKEIVLKGVNWIHLAQGMDWC